MDLMTSPTLKPVHCRLSEASGLMGTVIGAEPVTPWKFGTVLRANTKHCVANVNVPATVTVTVLALEMGRGNGQMIDVPGATARPMIELFAY